jgi:hypothetical protein
MKMMILLLFLLNSLNVCFASDQHDHSSHNNSDDGHYNDNPPVSDHIGQNNRKKEKEQHKEDHHDNEDVHAHETEIVKFGDEKAITSIRGDGKYFKLNKKSVETLGLITSKINKSNNGVYKVPKESLVSFRDKMGVYLRDSEGWYRLEEIKLLSATPTLIYIVCKNITAMDEIVHKGVSILRVAHLQASGQGGEGHAH